ncbi:MAG: HlyD family efflux transporter periplasmic adaptor subunit [Bacteroidetes bacterium]|nr:HlyD family efflux transporter periplasmic adaptor subunit [Bacteroidota bacterium]
MITRLSKRSSRALRFSVHRFSAHRFHSRLFGVHHLVGSARVLRVTLLLTILLSSCGGNTDEGNADAVMGTPVRVTHPSYVDLTETIDMNANTIFLKKESVRATFQGFIQSIHKNIGEAVAAGDLLLEMRTREAAAEDSLGVRVGDQAFNGRIGIRAHASGVLTALNFSAGDFVNEGEQIAEIANPASLRITLNVPYQYAAALDRRSVCTIQLPDGRRHPATIESILPSVDAVSQTQTFLLRAPAAGFLPEHLNLQASFPLHTVRHALVLPRAAVMSDEMQQHFWVMRVVGDTIAVRISIRRGLEVDSLVQLLAPSLDTTAWIVTDGAYALADSSRIVVDR